MHTLTLVPLPDPGDFNDRKLKDCSRIPKSLNDFARIDDSRYFAVVF
jgi:hypothetical protein